MKGEVVLNNSTKDLAWAIMNLDLHERYEFREGGSERWYDHILVGIVRGCPSGYQTKNGMHYAFIKVKTN